jgi:hypothetical protein
VDSVERLTERDQGAVGPGMSPEERIAELERINAELRRVNQRLTRERLGTADSAAAARLAGPARVPSRAAEGVSHALWRTGVVIKRVILFVLPHGLTLLLVSARGRDTDDNRWP